jgi:hypothetical protein
LPHIDCNGLVIVSRDHACFAGLGGRRPGCRGLDGREDREAPEESGEVQHTAYLRRNRGQTEEATEQPGAAPGTDQHREAAGVTKAHLRQVDDQPAEAGPKQAEELLAQGRDAGDVDFASQLGDSDAARSPDGKAQGGTDRGS